MREDDHRARLDADHVRQQAQLVGGEFEVLAVEALGLLVRGESQPAAQETKRSHNGALNVRYSLDIKRDALTHLRGLIAARAPWLRIRYAF